MLEQAKAALKMAAIGDNARALLQNSVIPRAVDRSLKSLIFSDALEAIIKLKAISARMSMIVA